jgi:hypothetical protein
MRAIRCSECQKLLRLTDSFAGKRVRCSASKHGIGLSFAMLGLYAISVIRRALH